MKKALQSLFLAPAGLFYALMLLCAFIAGKKRAFMSMSQFLALWPGLAGIWLRAAFYRLALTHSSQHTVIEFLTTFSSREARLAPHVSIGSGCNIGRVEIGEDCIIGSQATLLSGRRQHSFADPHTPIRLQEGIFEKITLGRDCWIGNGSVVMADIGEGSVVAAGSVVVRPVPPFSIVAGNPAKVIGSRLEGAAQERTLCKEPIKPCVMQLLVTLNIGGAESLALNLLALGKNSFDGFVLGLFQETGTLEKQLQDFGLPSLAMRAEKTGRLKGILNLRKAILDNNVAIMHTHAAWLLPYAIPAAKLAGIPLIYTEHSINALQTMPKLRRALKLAAPFISGIVCISEHIAEYLIKEVGINPKKINIIHNGVDTVRFSPEGGKISLPWNEKAFVFGTVARLHDAKDFPNLLKAFAIVHERRPEARLFIAGDGDQHSTITALITELGLEESVCLAGARSDVPDILRSLDVFVLSSKHEGFPMAVLEAMASGAPVIATRVGGLAALNADGDHIFLVNPENSAALAEAMNELLENADKRAELAAAGLKKVRSDYAVGTMAEQYFRLYLQKGLRKK